MLGIVALTALGAGAAACSAANEGAPETDESGGGGGDTSTDVGMGGVDGAGGSTTSTSTDLAKLVCPEVPQQILVLDFRSGWWSGGGGGTFHDLALQAVVQACPNVWVEYHHFEVSIRVKCVESTQGGPGCQELYEELPATAEAVQALFEKPSWDDYTQVWILSGSELDATDVTLTGVLFDHFLAQTQGSCIPVLVGAGDGFITHGNAVTSELGIGEVLSTELASPGFFSVQLDPNVAVGTRMYAGSELSGHALFQDVDSIADAVSNAQQSTHGDSVQDGNPAYQVVAHDSAGRPAIAVGAIDLPGDGDRPFVIDAGFQRYYGMQPAEGTYTLLQNLVKYLGNVGCKAEIPK